MNKKLNLCFNRSLSLATILGITITLFYCDTLFARPSVSNVPNMSSEDIQGIRGLLGSRQFQKLETYYTQLQNQYEKEGSINDLQLIIQYQPFRNTNPAMKPLLTDWVAQFPKSYPARLARGIYYLSVGHDKRGSKWASKTPQANFAQLNKYLDLATDDLLACRSLTAMPIASIFYLIDATHYRDGDVGNRYWIEEANRIDPGNFSPRRNYMSTLTPRWGGSYEEMYAYLQECRFQQIPPEHIRNLEAIIHNDIANMHRHDHKPVEAYTHYRQALMLLTGIETAETTEALRGLIYSALESNTLDRVSDEMDRYLHIVPEDPQILSYRGWLRENSGKLAEAMGDYKEAALQGDAWSQFQIAQILLYHKPLATEETRSEGLTWLKRSAKQGYEPAQKSLQRIEQGLPRSQ